MHKNKPRPVPTEFKLQFPETKLVEDVSARITAASNNRQVLKQLEKGEKFCFEGTWGTAMTFYSWLKKLVNQQYPIIDYTSSRTNRENLVSLTNNLYLRIFNHHPDLIKAPGNPWLKEFYPENNEFCLRFTDYLGLNGARQWYEKGLTFSGLSHKVYPFYGTYFPTRTEHLELFDQWLSRNHIFKKAVDIGCGCGVLSFYMLSHGIKNILATDINPNALASMKYDIERISASPCVKLMHTGFFQGLENHNPDLVVFNPPWIPMETHTTIDKAMYYGPDFFENFFNQAFQYLDETCRLVILFSNFAQVAGITNIHPIENEILNKQRFTLTEKAVQGIQQNPQSQKTWLSVIRSKEEAQLWILEKKYPTNHDS